MIPQGTIVRLRTTNGGDTIVRLLENYRPTYDAVIRVAGTYAIISALRIKSIEPWSNES